MLATVRVDVRPCIPVWDKDTGPGRTFDGMKHHLPTLSVLHYVYGVLELLGGMAVLVLIGMGWFLSSDWLAAQAGEALPPFLGAFLQGLGWVLFAILCTKGVLNIWSGWSISRATNRTLSMVTAALNCLNIPFGMALGIFTFIALSDREVREVYGLPV